MQKLMLSTLLALPALLLLTSVAEARGGRGGRGGPRNMGSVRHSRNVRNPGPERRDRDRDRGRNDRDHRDRHHPVARPARAAARHTAVRGTRIRRLPRGYHRYFWNHTYWYYYGGVYYTEDNDQYVVMDPVVGMTVDSLPQGAKHVKVDGKTLYVYDGVYYQAVWTNGDATYTVVKIER
jgi:hypothetical protein